jgi:hypothetical protein
MTDVVVIDANLLTLLVVGSASRDYVGKHKRLSGYSISDFDRLVALVDCFSEIVLVPHVLAEVSNLARLIKNPARTKIQSKLRTLIESSYEVQIARASGAARDEFEALGLTDAVILHLCQIGVNGITPTLLTVDSDLADRANSLGYRVIDYERAFQGL